MTGIYNEDAYDLNGEVYLIKTDQNGVDEWVRTYDLGGDDHCGFGVVQAPDNGYIVTGCIYDGYYSNEGSLFVMKTNSLGDTLWVYRLEDGDLECGYGIILDQDDNIIVAGVHNGQIIGVTGDVLLLKMDLDGNVIWSHTYDFRYQDVGYGLDLCSDGGFIIGGTTYEDEYGGYSHILMMKTDSDGNLEWDRDLGGGWGRCVIECSDGGYLLGCGDIIGMSSDRVHALYKTDESGNIVWSDAWGSMYFASCRSLIETADSYVSLGIPFIVEVEHNGRGLGINLTPGNGSLYSIAEAGPGYFTACGYEAPGVMGMTDARIIKFDDNLGSVVADIEPESPSVTVPQGGSFSFDVELFNNTDVEQTVAVRFYAKRLGWVTMHVIVTRTGITIPAGATVSQTNIIQNVPVFTPTGQWSYELHLLDNFTGETQYIKHFLFDVTAADGPQDGQVNEWNVSGWEETKSMTENMPVEFILMKAYPNPFNPETTVRFALSEATAVSLVIYDISGKEVAVLADGFRSAGIYEVHFDGSALSSGVYFAVLNAQGNVCTQKLLLLK